MESTPTWSWQAPHLIETTRAPIKQIDADGAYDVESVYQALEDIGARPIIPPRRHAILQNPAHESSAKAPRDAAINYINQHGNDENARKLWKQSSSYHARSLAETAVYRFKSHFGSYARAYLHQSTDRNRHQSQSSQQNSYSWNFPIESRCFTFNLIALLTEFL